MINVIPLRVGNSRTPCNDTINLFRIDLHRKINLFEAISRNVRTQLIGCLLLFSKTQDPVKFPHWIGYRRWIIEAERHFPAKLTLARFIPTRTQLIILQTMLWRTPGCLLRSDWNTGNTASIENQHWNQDYPAPAGFFYVWWMSRVRLRLWRPPIKIIFSMLYVANLINFLICELCRCYLSAPGIT